MLLLQIQRNEDSLGVITRCLAISDTEEWKQKYLKQKVERNEILSELKEQLAKKEEEFLDVNCLDLPAGAKTVRLPSLLY